MKILTLGRMVSINLPSDVSEGWMVHIMDEHDKTVLGITVDHDAGPVRVELGEAAPSSFIHAHGVAVRRL